MQSKDQRTCRLNADSAVTYSDLNNEFHVTLVELSKSVVLRRAWLQLQAIPYAAPSATIIPETMNRLLDAAFAQHEAIVNAIKKGDGSRAETLAREHGNIALKNLEILLRHPQHGASLVTFNGQNAPDARLLLRR
jgi:GntR family transcriptional regulator of vanillate catabolism